MSDAILRWSDMSQSALLPALLGEVPGIPGATFREVESLPEHIPGGTFIGPHTEAAPGALLFAVPGIARYLVEGGKTIKVAIEPGGDRSAVNLFLHGSARGFLIHQRGEVPLRATTLIAPNWRCVAICGPSGIGKSTVAAELMRRGWRLLADDITRVSWNGAAAIAWPSDNSLRLWQDTCEMLGIDSGGLSRVRTDFDKFLVPATAADTPSKLSLVVRLQIAPRLAVLPVPPSLSSALISHTSFKPRMVDPLGCRDTHVRGVEQIAVSGVRVVVMDGARDCAVGAIADQLARVVS